MGSDADALIVARSPIAECLTPPSEEIPLFTHPTPEIDEDNILPFAAATPQSGSAADSSNRRRAGSVAVSTNARLAVELFSDPHQGPTSHFAGEGDSVYPPPLPPADDSLVPLSKRHRREAFRALLRGLNPATSSPSSEAFDAAKDPRSDLSLREVLSILSPLLEYWKVPPPYCAIARKAILRLNSRREAVLRARDPPKVRFSTEGVRVKIPNDTTSVTSRHAGRLGTDPSRAAEPPDLFNILAQSERKRRCSAGPSMQPAISVSTPPDTSDALAARQLRQLPMAAANVYRSPRNEIRLDHSDFQAFCRLFMSSLKRRESDSASTSEAEKESRRRCLESSGTSSLQAHLNTCGWLTPSLPVYRRHYLRYNRSFFLSNQPSGYPDLWKIFEKVTVLGRGMFGVVWLAREKCSGKKVCIKAIPKKQTCLAPKLLRREINILCTLDHPNVMKLTSAYEDHQNCYLVCEYLPGENLLTVLARVLHHRRCISELAVQSWLRQILSGLVHCHSRHICHKDLKPENIVLLQPEEALSSIKIVDFGLAEWVRPGERVTGGAGSPYYMAPEVFSHHGHDEKADVWSCGVLAYLLFSGHLPFSATNCDEFRHAIKTQVVQYPTALFGHVSKLAVDALHTMLTKHPDARPTARDMLRHPWFDLVLPGQSAIQEATERRKNGPALQSLLIEHVRRTSLQRVCLNLVALQLPLASMDRAALVFDEWDADHDGVLSYPELAAGLRSINVSEEMIPQIIGALRASQDLDDEVDGARGISYTEFAAALIRTHHDCFEESLWAVFRQFDREGNGRITQKDLEQILELGGLTAKPVATGSSERTSVLEVTSRGDSAGSGTEAGSRAADLDTAAQSTLLPEEEMTAMMLVTNLMGDESDKSDVSQPVQQHLQPKKACSNSAGQREAVQSTTCENHRLGRTCTTDSTSPPDTMEQMRMHNTGSLSPSKTTVGIRSLGTDDSSKELTSSMDVEMQEDESASRSEPSSGEGEANDEDSTNLSHATREEEEAQSRTIAPCTHTNVHAQNRFGRGEGMPENRILVTDPDEWLEEAEGLDRSSGGITKSDSDEPGIRASRRQMSNPNSESSDATNSKEGVSSSAAEAGSATGATNRSDTPSSSQDQAYIGRSIQQLTAQEAARMIFREIKGFRDGLSSVTEARQSSSGASHHSHVSPKWLAETADSSEIRAEVDATGKVVGKGAVNTPQIAWQRETRGRANLWEGCEDMQVDLEPLHDTPRGAMTSQHHHGATARATDDVLAARRERCIPPSDNLCSHPNGNNAVADTPIDVTLPVEAPSISFRELLFFLRRDSILSRSSNGSFQRSGPSQSGTSGGKGSGSDRSLLPRPHKRMANVSQTSDNPRTSKNFRSPINATPSSFFHMYGGRS